jgi:uroporphyrinogen decarboxylase
LLAGAEALTIDTIIDPDFCKRLLEFSTDVIIPYVKAQKDAGADAVMLLEPTAALLSPDMFMEFVNPYIDAIAREVDISLILHVCGNTTHLVDSMCKADICGLSLDSMVDLVAISKDMPQGMALSGNVSPVETMLDGTPEQVYSDTYSLMESMEGFSDFVLGTGCDLPTKTPIENIASFFKAASDFNKLG